MVGPRDGVVGKGVTDERAEAALHAVADDRIADLLGHGETNSDEIVVIAALADKQHEPRRRRALAPVGGKEVGALA